MSETDLYQCSSYGSTVVATTDPVPEEITEDMFLFEILDEYVLIKIFSYFNLKERMSLRRVCLKWKTCVDSSFKKETVFNVDTIGSSTRMSEKAVCLLIEMCCNVRDISLQGLSLFKSSSLEDCDSIVDTIVINCSHLQSMDFGSYDKFDELFIKNANYFRRLKKIISVNISETALNLIIDSENLESIDIKRNDKISELNFKRLGPKVRQLDLSESHMTRMDVFKGLVEGNGRQLEELTIDVNHSHKLSLICDNLLKLKELEINLDSKNHWDFKRFSNLIHLKSLWINNYCHLKTTELNELIRALRPLKITTLGINDLGNCGAVTDGSLEEIRLNCPLIEKLKLFYVYSLTGTGMHSISQMKNIKCLQFLRCFQISNQIEIVITSCPLLQKLILHKCSYITNTTFEKFIEKAKFSPEQQFYLDIIGTIVSKESLPLPKHRPKNLILLNDFKQCPYDCCQQYKNNSDSEEESDRTRDPTEVTQTSTQNSNRNEWKVENN